jgi:hypothetical protein
MLGFRSDAVKTQTPFTGSRILKRATHHQDISQYIHSHLLAEFLIAELWPDYPDFATGIGFPKQTD